MKLSQKVRHQGFSEAELNNRIAKASTAFGRLKMNVWECRGLSTTIINTVELALLQSTRFFVDDQYLAGSAIFFRQRRLQAKKKIVGRGGLEVYYRLSQQKETGA